MKNKLIKLLITALFSTILGCSENPQKNVAPENPKRVVSLAPSITETIFAINAEEFLVGRTKWCNFPEGTAKIASIGDYMSPSSEQILKLNPDAVLMLPEHQASRDKIESLGIPIITVENRSVAQIFGKIRQLGEIFERENEAEILVSEIEQKIVSPRKTTKKLLQKFYNDRQKYVEREYIAGNPFHNELLEIIGAKNACQLNQPYPKIRRKE